MKDLLITLKKNISGDIDEWKVAEDGTIPVILGNNFKDKFSIGEFIQDNDRKYKVVGFFKKDTLFFDYYDVAGYSYLLNSSFVIPLNKEAYFKEVNYDPIIIFLKEDNNKINIEREIKDICDTVIIESIEKNLNDFLEIVNKDKVYDISRILIVTIMTTGTLLITISYKIFMDKERIGILYSFGISRKNIYAIFSLEFMLQIIIGIIIGSIIYVKKCEIVYYIFINQNLLGNLYIGILIAMVIVSISLIIGFRELNNLTPKEMMGGIVE